MSWMSAKPLALVLGLLAVPGGEKFAEGVRHFREGRYEKSYALLRDVEKAHGEKALPAALLVDLTLAASKTGRFDEAEGYAERVAARDASLGYLRDQVVGAARYDAARKAARAAEMPDPKNPGTPIPGSPNPGSPTPQIPDIKKLDEALTSVRRAIEAFGSAILARPDALEARRNLERALELEKELEKKKKEAEDKKKKDEEKKKDDKEKKDEDKKDEDKKDDKKDKNKDDKKDDKEEENKDDKKQDKKDDKKGEGDQKKPEKSDPKDKPEDQPLKQLSPEEKKRLEKVLEDYQKALVELKKSRAPKHEPGKKDW